MKPGRSDDLPNFVVNQPAAAINLIHEFPVQPPRLCVKSLYPFLLLSVPLISPSSLSALFFLVFASSICGNRMSRT